MTAESGIDHLITAQTRDLSTLDSQIRELEKSIYSYNCLIATLSSVDSKVKHDIMVPIGKHAFVPGNLIHTNEVWVHLGADMLALQSAKQASALAERRRENFRKNLSMLQEGRKITEDWKSTAEKMGMEFSPSGGGITEHVSEQEHNQWQEAHKARVKEAKKNKPKGHMQNPSLGIDDDAERRLWAKLDELERLEELEDEELLGDGGDQTEVNHDVPSDSHLREDESTCDRKPPVRKRVELRFKLTSKESVAEASSSTDGVFRSPADIGRTGRAVRRKSSLKVSGSVTAAEKPEKSRVVFGDSVSVKTIDNLAKPSSLATSVLRATSIFQPYSPPPNPGVRAAHVPQRPVAVASSVAESAPYTPANATQGASSSSQSEDSEPPKRVSRFRAARVMEKSS